MNKLHKINTSYKNVKEINKSPTIYLCDKFLTDRQCEYMIHKNKIELVIKVVWEICIQFRGEKEYIEVVDVDEQIFKFIQINHIL